MVRHGFGVELQLTQKGDCISKYEGFWKKDIK
jgi:hypothetical protein